MGESSSDYRKRVEMEKKRKHDRNTERYGLPEARREVESSPLPRPKIGNLFTMPESSRGGQIKTKDYAPDNISPHGDLGILDDKEQKAFFQRPIKNSNAEWRASAHLPVGKVRSANDGGTLTPYGAVYPYYDKGVYSGLKAGGKVATQRRGVSAMTNQPVAVSQKGNSKHPMVSKRMRNV